MEKQLEVDCLRRENAELKKVLALAKHFVELLFKFRQFVFHHCQCQHEEKQRLMARDTDRYQLVLEVRDRQKNIRVTQRNEDESGDERRTTVLADENEDEKEKKMLKKDGILGQIKKLDQRQQKKQDDRQNKDILNTKQLPLVLATEFANQTPNSPVILQFNPLHLVVPAQQPAGVTVAQTDKTTNKKESRKRPAEVPMKEAKLRKEEKESNAQELGPNFKQFDRVVVQSPTNLGSVIVLQKPNGEKVMLRRIPEDGSQMTIATEKSLDLINLKQLQVKQGKTPEFIKCLVERIKQREKQGQMRMMKTTEGKQIFQCTQCPCQFELFEYFERHFNDKHQGKVNLNQVTSAQITGDDKIIFHCPSGKIPETICLQMPSGEKVIVANKPTLGQECEDKDKRDEDIESVEGLIKLAQVPSLEIEKAVCFDLIKEKIHENSESETKSSDNEGKKNMEAVRVTISKTKSLESERQHQSQLLYRQSLGQVKRVWTEEGSNYLQCGHCAEKFDEFGEFELHFDYRHAGKIIECHEKDCRKKIRKNELDEHVRQEHGSVFRCSVDGCNYNTRKVNQFRVHVDRHQGKWYRCAREGCSYKTMVQKALNDHLLWHDDKLSFACPQPDCKYQGISREHLQAHKKRHREAMIQCTWQGCQRKFKTNSMMKKHVKYLHQGIREFPCDWPGCEYKAKDAKQWKEHTKTHTKCRFFPCPWSGCDKSYVQKLHLDEHLVTHTGQEPFACHFEGCRKKFSAKSNLSNHLRTHRKK